MILTFGFFHVNNKLPPIGTEVLIMGSEGEMFMDVMIHDEGVSENDGYDWENYDIESYPLWAPIPSEMKAEAERACSVDVSIKPQKKTQKNGEERIGGYVVSASGEIRRA